MTASHSGESAPKISVALPVYNAARYLREALESVLAQIDSDFELLALNDGSTDDSETILREYERRDSRVRVFSRENKGLVISLNELIGVARGAYFARMDSDDICMPQRLKVQSEFLDDNPDHVVVGSWFEKINELGQPIGIIKDPVDHHNIDKKNLAGHTAICHPTAMIRIDALRAVGGYEPDKESAEDLDLWLRLAEVGKIANIAKALVKYRMHSGSISEKNCERQNHLKKMACEDAWERRGIQGTYEALAWRPGDDKQSQLEFNLKYGWVAWNHGYYATWWSYAKRALILRPFSIASWKLLIIGLIKSPK